MGLFDRFKQRTNEVAPDAVPVGAGVTAGKALAAPVSGRVESIGDAPDPAFASGMLGPGCVVWPSEDEVFSPVSGTVAAALPHAVGIAVDSGYEILLHIGIDTVEMQGDGFTSHVSQGDRIEAGHPLVRFDRERVAAAGYSDCVIVVVSNLAGSTGVRVVPELGESVKVGETLLEFTD